MARLFNPTPRDLMGMYAGMPYTIPKGKYVTIKSRRALEGVLHDDEIAAHLMSQLHQIGLCLVNEEEPQSEEEMTLDGLRRFRRFAHQQISDFNGVNMKLAAEGHTVMLVPNNLRILKKQMEDVERRIGREADDDGSKDFVSSEQLDIIGSREKANFARTREIALQALRSGNPEGALAALSQNPEDAVTAAGGQMSGGAPAEEPAGASAEADPSSEFIDPPVAAVRGGSRIPPGLRKGRPTAPPSA